MKLSEALNSVSNNLFILLNRIEDLEESDNLSIEDIDLINTIKDMVVSCSRLILSISDNKKTLHKDYMIFEIKVAHKFCQKSLIELTSIEERSRLF